MPDWPPACPDLFPADHIEFMSEFEDQIIIGDYAFVHAGNQTRHRFERAEIKRYALDPRRISLVHGAP